MFTLPVVAWDRIASLLSKNFQSIQTLLLCLYSRFNHGCQISRFCDFLLLSREIGTMDWKIASRQLTLYDHSSPSFHIQNSNKHPYKYSQTWWPSFLLSLTSFLSAFLWPKPWMSRTMRTFEDSEQSRTLPKNQDSSHAQTQHWIPCWEVMIIHALPPVCLTLSKTVPTFLMTALPDRWVSNQHPKDANPYFLYRHLIQSVYVSVCICVVHMRMWRREVRGSFGPKR